MLINYVEEYSSNKNPYVFSLKEKIGVNAYQSIFNDNEIEHFIKNLRENKINIRKIIFPKNVIYNSLKNEKSKPYEKIIEYSKLYIYLSKPVFTSNKKYCLIGFSNGIKNGMQGGISIYKNENGNWEFVTTINDWIE